MSDRVIATWDDAERFCRKVAELVADLDERPCGIYAPARGGLCLGVMVSHLTGLPMLMHPDPKCVVVDDIADTGATLQGIVEKYGMPFYAMFYKEGGPLVPDMYMFAKREGEWTVFPWELQ